MLTLDPNRLIVTSFEIPSETETNVWTSCIPNCGGTDGGITIQNQQEI